MQRTEPIFNVPAAVVACIGVLAAVHAILAMLPEASQEWWTLALAFIPVRYAGFSDEVPGGAPAMATSLKACSASQAPPFMSQTPGP